MILRLSTRRKPRIPRTPMPELTGDLVGRLTAALLAEPWTDSPRSAHGEHRVYAECALCCGDVDRLAAFVVRAMEPEVLAEEVDAFHAAPGCCVDGDATFTQMHDHLQAAIDRERQRAEQAEKDAKHERAIHRMATQHAYDADAREAEADAKAARAEARYQTERAAHRREVAARFQAEQERDTARASVQRLRDLAQRWIDNEPDKVTESTVRLIFADAGQQILAELDQPEAPDA